MPGPTLARREYLGLAGTAAVGSLAGCTAAVDGSWPMWGHDAAETWSSGAAPGPGGSLSVAWREAPGWLDRPDYANGPVVGEGRVVAGLVYQVSSRENDGGVAAFDDRGSVQWSVDTESPQTAPPVVADGLVFHTNEADDVVARSLDDGEVAWRYQPEAAVDDPLRVRRDELLLGTSDGAIRTVAVADGTERRNLPLDGEYAPWPRAAPDGSLLVAPRGEITCLEPDGRHRWSVPKPGASRGYVLGRGACFLADTTSAGRTLRAIDLADGTDRWRRPLPAGRIGGFALADDELLVPASAAGSDREDSRVVAFDVASGERRWTASIDAERVGRVSAASSHAYVAATGERLLAVDLERAEVVDSFGLAKDRLPWRPVVAGQRLYGATSDGSVVAVE